MKQNNTSRLANNGTVGRNAIMYPANKPARCPKKLACGTITEVNISAPNGMRFAGTETAPNRLYVAVAPACRQKHPSQLHCLPITFGSDRRGKIDDSRQRYSTRPPVIKSMDCTTTHLPRQPGTPSTQRRCSCNLLSELWRPAPCGTP